MRLPAFVRCRIFKNEPAGYLFPARNLNPVSLHTTSVIDFAKGAPIAGRCASMIDRRFPTQRKMFLSPPVFRAEPRMNQFTFVVLTVLGLSLAGYFGLAAWRVSDGHAEITGTIQPSHR
jgi:hypothetical protein